MSKDKLSTIPDADEELDDPYIHTVSTEEFVETVERDNHQDKENGISPSEE